MSRQRDALPKVIQQLSDEFPGCGVILHGSVQHGYERDGSDIDLFVITSDGDEIRWDLEREVEGVSVQICFHPTDWFRRQFAEQPYMFAGIAYGEIVHDATGLATEHQKMTRNYFKSHPEVAELWRKQFEDVRAVRLRGRYENGKFKPAPEDTDHHLWWDRFARSLQDRMETTNGTAQPSVPGDA